MYYYFIFATKLHLLHAKDSTANEREIYRKEEKGFYLKNLVN